MAQISACSYRTPAPVEHRLSALRNVRSLSCLGVQAQQRRRCNTQTPDQAASWLRSNHRPYGTRTQMVSKEVKSKIPKIVVSVPVLLLISGLSLIDGRAPAMGSGALPAGGVTRVAPSP